jgi:pyrroloquinoline-quinone synthase
MESIKSPTETRFTDELLTILREAQFRDPFFEAVRAGQMSRAGVKQWVLQASLVVREFTRFISAIHANCPHRDAQQLMAENLWEEHGRGHAERDHYFLIRKLAKSLGATDNEIDNATPLAEAAAYIDQCFKATRDGSFIDGMATIGIGIEYSIPAFFGALAEMFCAQYGLAQKDVAYLLVHVGEDEDHARRALELIEKYADMDDVQQRAKQALRDLLAVKHRFAEALYAHCSAAA